MSSSRRSFRGRTHRRWFSTFPDTDQSLSRAKTMGAGLGFDLRAGLSFSPAIPMGKVTRFFWVFGVSVRRLACHYHHGYETARISGLQRAVVLRSRGWDGSLDSRHPVRSIAPSKSPLEMRIFAAKSMPLIWTCGGFSSWKNIRTLNLPNRLISGMRCVAPHSECRVKFALVGALV